MSTVAAALLVGCILKACLVATSASSIPWPFYTQSADEALGYLQEASARHPHLMKYDDMEDMQTGERLPVVTVTDFSTGLGAKQVIVLVFAEHAREIITTEIALWLVKVLIGEADQLLQWPATAVMQAENKKHNIGQGGDMAEWAQHLLRNTVFKVLPLVNIAGRKLVDNGNFCMRKKTNGVDLNRNYPVAFTRQSMRSEEYGGPAAFSEAESRIIRSLVEGESKPDVYVDVHSGEWALYFPWDSKMRRGEDLPRDTEDLVGHMNIHCKCMNGPAGKVAGYLALGSSMDYVYSVGKVPYPLTVEVYGPNGLGTFAAGGHPRRLMQARLRGSASMQLRCLSEYNPHTEALYQDTVARWLGSFLAMADYLAPLQPTAKRRLPQDPSQPLAPPLQSPPPPTAFLHPHREGISPPPRKPVVDRELQLPQPVVASGTEREASPEHTSTRRSPGSSTGQLLLYAAVAAAAAAAVLMGVRSRRLLHAQDKSRTV